MKTVAVIMSTYKGALHICRQLDSIFKQSGVQVRVFIRDDHSPDNTVEVVEKYRHAHSDRKIEYIVGDNEGYAKSFWDALCMAGDADYYAFSDQDDIWKQDKLFKLILPMENSKFYGPKLAYCKMQRSDENKVRLNEQVKILKPKDLSKKLCLTQTYNYGAATVFNKSAKDLICRTWPDRKDVPHDLWAGLLCYWFGKVFYVDEELYYWIRYGTSVTGEGTKKSGRLYRIKETLKGLSYPNVADNLLKSYDDLLIAEDREFLRRISTYKESPKSKVRLLLDPSFKRHTFVGSIILKAGIFFNWF